MRPRSPTSLSTFFVFVLLTPACGGGGGGVDASGVADLASGADLAGADLAGADAATSADMASSGQLLCAKYGPPSLAPFQGVQYGVDNTPGIGSAPAPTGGTIVDGTYVITSNITHGGGNSTGTPQLRSLLILEGGAWFYRIEFDGVDDMNFSGGYYTSDPIYKTMSFGDRLCGSGGTPSDEMFGYSATSTSLKTYLNKSASTPATIKEITYTRQ